MERCRPEHVVGEHGGAAFLLLCLAVLIVMGLPVMIAELAIGRRGRSDAVGAGVLTLADYAVIGGWVGRYLVGYLTGATMNVPPTAFGAFFENLISGTFAPLAWALGFVAITTLIVLSGVRHGIEHANAVLMPLLALLLVAMAAYALTLPGAGEGLRSLLTRDRSASGQGEAYLAAVRRPGVRPPRRAGRERSSTGPGWGGPGRSRCLGSRRR